MISASHRVFLAGSGLAAMVSCIQDDAQAKNTTNHSESVQSSSAAANPYCDREGYMCKASGWTTPWYGGFSRGQMGLFEICADIQGKETLYSLHSNPTSGDRFVEFSYDGRIFAYGRQIKFGDSIERFAIVDYDLDGIFETRFAPNNYIPCLPNLRYRHLR